MSRATPRLFVFASGAARWMMTSVGAPYVMVAGDLPLRPIGRVMMQGEADRDDARDRLARALFDVANESEAILRAEGRKEKITHALNVLWRKEKDPRGYLHRATDLFERARLMTPRDVLRAVPCAREHVFDLVEWDTDGSRIPFYQERGADLTPEMEWWINQLLLVGPPRAVRS